MNEEIYNAGYREGARLNPVPDDIKECLAWLRGENVRYEKWDTFDGMMDDANADEAAVLQLLEYLGVL